MKTSDKGIVALMMHEDIVPGPYLDSRNVWTYGIGHAETSGLPPNPRKMKRGMPADLDAELVKVFNVFRADLRKYEAAVFRAMPNAKQHEFDAAVSFHYNTGSIGEARWVKKLAVGDVAGAARSIMSWTKNKELVKRREAERDLLLLGKYPPGEITIFGVTDAGRVIWKPVRMIAAADALAMLRNQKSVKKESVQNQSAGAEKQGSDQNTIKKTAWLAGIIAAIAALFGGKK